MHCTDLPPELPCLDLMGMAVARLDSQSLLDHMFGALSERRGGWLVTANLDFLRRFDVDPVARALYMKADIRVADGMPLVWAAALKRQPLPERVAGSLLIWAIAERAALEGRSIYLLGGAPGAAAGTAARFRELWPEIDVCGLSDPILDSPPTPEQLALIADEIVPLAPDLLMVGFGSPKQEQVIEALQPDLQTTWMMGVGISFSFVAGQVQNAPAWMRRCGLEWAHRMFQEPGRLAKRYLIDDAPFALRLFVHSLSSRAAGRHKE
jgi:N-acetylglucosaminyldiphosphoundecaprenol N-acetyl-beta-D-mannosaminyltransferase